MMTTLLITGALGHIGSRLIHSLRPGEFSEVMLLDDLTTQRYCSFYNLPDGVPYEFIEADICETPLEPMLDDVDVVIHLAAITNAAGSFAIQEHVERVNFLGTERLAKACAATGTRLIFISTTSVYGVSDGVVDEDCPISDLKPQSPYAASKLQAEQFLAQLAETAGLRHVVCRFGTIYGTSRGMRFHTAVNKFCWQASLGEPLTVWTTALDQKRPYLDLGDAVDALKFIVARDLFDGRIYNVLTENLTVRQIVDTIREFIPDVQTVEVDSPIMNQLSYTVDCKRFCDLGFRFQGNIRDGVAETLRLLRGLTTRRGVLRGAPLRRAG